MLRMIKTCLASVEYARCGYGDEGADEGIVEVRLRRWSRGIAVVGRRARRAQNTWQILALSRAACLVYLALPHRGIQRAPPHKGNIDLFGSWDMDLLPALKSARNGRCQGLLPRLSRLFSLYIIPFNSSASLFSHGYCSSLFSISSLCFSLLGAMFVV